MNICKLTPPEITVCFTGHRRIHPGDIAALSCRVDEVTRRLYDAGARYFRCGGAVGFDTLAALSVIRLCKTKHVESDVDDVKFTLVLPCPDQTKRWAFGNRSVYERIKADADEIVYASKSYTRECMLARDRALVDGAGICVAYLNKGSGGTAYTVDYAKSSGLEIINLGRRAIK